MNNTHFLTVITTLSQAEKILSRKMDSKLGGIGYTDFLILYTLSQSPEKKLRRIDLSEKLGVTPSGVTRSLLPMEKIGLVSREVNEKDARSSYVGITGAGENMLHEALLRIDEIVLEEPFFQGSSGSEIIVPWLQKFSRLF